METGKEKEQSSDRFSLSPATRKMRRLSVGIFFLLGFILGALIFWNPFDLSWLPSGAREQGERPVSAPESEAEEQGLWTCPMHPEVVESEPGSFTRVVLSIPEMPQQAQ